MIDNVVLRELDQRTGGQKTRHVEVKVKHLQNPNFLLPSTFHVKVPPGLNSIIRLPRWRSGFYFDVKETAANDFYFTC